MEYYTDRHFFYGSLAALTYAVFAVLCELIVGSAATLVVSRGQLHTVLLTASISDSTGVDGWGETHRVRHDRSTIKGDVQYPNVID